MVPLLQRVTSAIAKGKGDAVKPTFLGVSRGIVTSAPGEIAKAVIGNFECNLTQSLLDFLNAFSTCF